MNPVLQDALPEGQAEVAGARLPAMRPVDGPWLQCDGAYSAQMRLRRQLLEEREGDVYAQMSGGLPAARGFLAMVLECLPEGFAAQDGQVICRDGHAVTLEWDAPLFSVGQILQQDVCILQKHGDEHVLTGAVMCFPASWTLAQKIGKPLIGIHDPVSEYDNRIAKRVQRLFDGVREGQPMWRANLLRYTDPALYQPRPENDPRPIGGEDATFIRSERQTVLRLPQPDSAAFVIHTSVVRAGSHDE